MCKFIHNISRDFSRSLSLVIFKTAANTAPLPNGTAAQLLLLRLLCATQFSSTYRLHLQQAEASGQLHVPPLGVIERISGNH